MLKLLVLSRVWESECPRLTSHRLTQAESTSGCLFALHVLAECRIAVSSGGVQRAAGIHRETSGLRQRSHGPLLPRSSRSRGLQMWP